MTSELPKNKADPGWNDPPLFSYESHQAHIQSSKRPGLTKRVPFPASPQATPPKPLTAIPPSTCTPPLLPPSQKPPLVTPNKDEDTQSDEEYSFEIVYNNFEILLNAIAEKNNEKVISDVRKRIHLLQTMWKDDKFNNEVKNKISKLSEALKEKDVECCAELQRSLMVDHPSLCSSWISAVRQLIALLRPCEQLDDIGTSIPAS